MSEMTTFSLTPYEIGAIASIGAACANAADRKMSPILSAIHLTVTPERVTAVATDRYIVTELSFPLGGAVHNLPAYGTAHTLQMTDKDWAALAKITSGPDYRGHDIAFTTGDAVERSRVRVESYGRVLGDFTQVEGNHPAASRLFSDEVHDMHGTPGFMPDKIVRATKAWAPEHTTAAQRKVIVWVMGSNSASGDDRKVTPVVLTAATETSTVLRSLVQTNMPRR